MIMKSRERTQTVLFGKRRKRTVTSIAAQKEALPLQGGGSQRKKRVGEPGSRPRFTVVPRERGSRGKGEKDPHLFSKGRQNQSH